MKGKHYTKSKYKTSNLVLVIMILLLMCSVTLGKYISEEQEKTLAEANKFIFTSNYSTDNIYNIYDDYVVITLSNYELDFVNESNIEYEVLVKDQDGNEINYSDSGNGTIIGNEKNITEIRVEDLEKAKTYTVQINTVKPYKETLNLQFYVLETLPTENYYSIRNNDGWIELDIYVGANVPSEGITVDYTSFLPDNTNEIMRGWISTAGKDKGIITGLTVYSHYSFIFFGEGIEITKTKIENNTISL